MASYAYSGFVTKISAAGLRAGLVVAVLAAVSSALAGNVIFVHTAATGAGDGSSWSNAFVTVQPALDAAQAGDQVWVAAGRYVERITLKEGVGLYGGFAGTEDAATFDVATRNIAGHPTILDANRTGTVVTAPTGATAACRIDGFTITGGYTGDSGGGVYVASASPTIANNTISGNSARQGGGLYAWTSSLVVTGNAFTANICTQWGGGLCVSQSSPIITGNMIANNNAFGGGGLYGGALATGSIGANTFVGNQATDGGAMELDNSGLTVSGNTIVGNSASHAGGLLLYTSTVSVENNRFAGNTAASTGGGLQTLNGDPTIVNNTFIANNAVMQGGAMDIGSSTATIANTIVAFNSSGIRTGSGAIALLNNCVHGNTAYNYSGVTDPTGTNGNISVDPGLASASYGGWHLQPGSLCIDAGENTRARGSMDLDGQARIQPVGGTVDIGADESDGSDWPAAPFGVVRVSPTGNDAYDGSSWDLAKRSVQAGVSAASAIGGEVWVRGGTYNERLILSPFADVYGGFAGTESARDERDWQSNVVTLDGQQQGSVVTGRTGYQSAGRLDGFTITHGSFDYGGGVYLMYSSTSIAHCTVTGNSASYAGGGFYLMRSSAILASNAVVGNTAQTGAGAYLGASWATVANNSIVGNKSTGNGGGLCLSSSDATITGTIVAFNSSGVYKSGTLTPTLRANCVFGNTSYNYSGITDPTGTNGNISANPLFVQNPDPNTPGAIGDLHLQAGSPCINAGNNADVWGTTDLDGFARIVGPTVDMGAYEYPGPFPGDLNGDGFVNADDLGIFAGCLAGPEWTVAPECGAADLDGDSDVDLADFARLQGLAN